MTSKKSGAISALVALLASVALVLVPAPSAHAEDVAEEVAVTGTLAPDGRLSLTETYTFGGAAPATITKRFGTRQSGVGDLEYVQKINDITATAGGQPVETEIDHEEGFTVVTFDTGGASEPVELSYTVDGAVRKEQDSSILNYRVLQGLSFATTNFTATIEAPGIAQGISCHAGPPNSTKPCKLAAQGTHDAPNPHWEDGPRGAGEQVTAIAPFASNVVAVNEILEYRWTLGRAFGVGPAELGAALGALVLGGLIAWLLHRRTGVDVRHDGTSGEKIAEFSAVDGDRTEFRHFGTIRPGHVGTVSDERVDPIDVTATLVDLAVRGHLLITELPREREFSQTDWTLTRRQGNDDLRPFEEHLLTAVAPEGETGKVSEIAHHVQGQIGQIQDDLYDEVVERGWYERRPDQTRNQWQSVAFGALVLSVVITGVLVAMTTFGLLGLALIAVALGLVFVSQEMPRRTAKGSGLLQGLGRLSADLHTHPTDEMPKGRKYHELSEVLPFAIVLGGADRWLDALAAADDDDDPDSTDLDWYHGPDNWHLRDLPDSLRNFITTVSGNLFTR
ncbi:DUF2207 family protein [Propionibacteriaceae bacterium Y1685]